MKPRDVINKLKHKYKIKQDISTIYHWEKCGLIPDIALTRMGRKIYSDKNFERIVDICVLTRFRLELDQVKRYLVGDELTKRIVFENSVWYKKIGVPYVERDIGVA